jgi:hypothetical protein
LSDRFLTLAILERIVTQIFTTLPSPFPKLSFKGQPSGEQMIGIAGLGEDISPQLRPSALDAFG